MSGIEGPQEGSPPLHIGQPDGAGKGFVFARFTSKIKHKKLKLQSIKSRGKNVPVRSLTTPSTRGGKNPPKPPAAPTSPATLPTEPGKYSGTSLNTAPLPRPISPATPSAPSVNVIMSGQARKIAITLVKGKAHFRMLRPPNLSANTPPKGRIAVASTTNPAVRKPAS